MAEIKSARERAQAIVQATDMEFACGCGAKFHTFAELAKELAKHSNGRLVLTWRRKDPRKGGERGSVWWSVLAAIVLMFASMTLFLHVLFDQGASALGYVGVAWGLAALTMMVLYNSDNAGADMPAPLPRAKWLPTSPTEDAYDLTGSSAYYNPELLVLTLFVHDMDEEYGETIVEALRDGNDATLVLTRENV